MIIDWGDLESTMSLAFRSPWQVFAEDIGEALLGEAPNPCYRDQDDLVKAVGARGAFLRLPDAVRAPYVDVSLAELYAWSKFEDAGGSHESWLAMDNEGRAEFFSQDPEVSRLRGLMYRNGCQRAGVGLGEFPSLSKLRRLREGDGR